MKDKLNIVIAILALSCIVVGVLLFSDNSGGPVVKNPPSLSFNNGVVILKIGESKRLEPVVTNLDNYVIEWSSDNPNVASVDDGVVKALAKGNVIITASISEHDLSSSVRVVVNDIEPESIKLDKNSLELKVGSSERLNYTIIPSTATDTSVFWKSSDSKVATINEGVVEAVSEGTAIITISTSNGITDTCMVTVKSNEVPVTEINFDKESYSLYINEKITINATILPENATNKELIWSTSNNKIATIKDGVIEGISKGNVTITATNIKKNVKRSVNVTVNKKHVDVSPKEITIVGDSRMVGLCGYSWYKNEGGSCVSKGAMGYYWLEQTAIGQVNSLSSSKKKNIVVNLGVNDLSHIDKYINKYRELVTGSWKDYHLFLLSVNPTSGKRSDLNTSIESFNNKLKNGLKNYKNVTYCDSYSYLKKHGFSSGDGIHYKENTSKDIYNYLKQCVSDYYNE